MTPIFMRIWLMNATVVCEREIDEVSFRSAWDMSRACRPMWASPISPSSSARGTSAATESITMMSTAPLRTRVSVISSACSASMKAAVPPAFWASAIVCSMSVVFPDDSGPKISMTRPRGIPPVPSARSSPSEPDGMTGTSGGASVAPSFMMDPLPNCFSIWAIASSMARFFSSRSAIAFSFNCQVGSKATGLYSSAEGHFHQGCIDGAARTKLALDEFHRGQREPSHYAVLLGGEDRLQRARLHTIANAGQGQMGREGARLLREPEARRAVLHSRLKSLHLLHVVVAPVQSQPDHAGRARIRESAQPAGFQREGTGRRGRFGEDLAQGVHLRLLDVSQKLERQMDALWLGPSDLDSLTAPSRTGDLPFQLCLYASYLTLQLVGKLNGDEGAQHFFMGLPFLFPRPRRERVRVRGSSSDVGAYRDTPSPFFQFR